MVMDTAMADMVTMDMVAMDTTDTTARGKLKLLLLLSPLPMPLLDTDITAMVTDMVMAMDTATAMDTGTDTGTDTATDTTARGRLMLMPTTAVDTDTVMAMATMVKNC